MKTIISTILVVLAAAGARTAQASTTITVALSAGGGTTACTFIASSFTDAFTTIGIGIATPGAGSGRIRLGDIKVKKLLDKCSAPLFAHLVNSNDFPTVTITVSAPLGVAVTPVLSVTLTNATVTEIDHSDGTGDDAPLEGVTFAYETIKIVYVGQGSGQGSTVTCSSKTASCSVLL
jgi:type VI protein secretion system component Hcp